MECRWCSRIKICAKYSNALTKLVLIESASCHGYPIYKKDATFQPIVGEYYPTKDAMANDPVQVVPVAIALKNNDQAFMEQVWKALIYNVKVPEEASFKRFMSETMKQRNLVDIDWALTTFNMSSTSNGMTPGDGTIKNVVCPILSIHGKQDLVVPVSMFEETKQALMNVTAISIETFSHSPLTDNPSLLATLIRDFLK